MTEDDLRQNMKSRYWRLNNLYYVIDDHGRKVKFRMNRIQYMLYRTMWWLNIVLKSRQHGITTFICILFLDACLFTPNVRAGIIAHLDKDAKRIFRDKVKYAYENLPEALKRELYATKDDAGELLLCNNSGVYVSTSMRSGTYQYLHVSEFGYMCVHLPARAAEVISGALETVHAGGMIVIESTAEGPGNEFHRLCKIARDKGMRGEKLTTMDYKYFFFPWYEKPENVLHEDAVIPQDLAGYFEKIERESAVEISRPHKNWYAKKREILGEKIFKEHPSNFDEAFMASTEGAFYGRLMIDAQQGGRVLDFEHDPAHQVHTCWDLGDMYTSIWFFQTAPGRIDWIDHYYDNQGLGLAEYARVLQSKKYVYGEHFAGPDLATSNRKSSHTGKTTLDVAASLGIHFTLVTPHRFEDRIEAVRSILPISRFHKTRCSLGIEGLEAYRKEKDEALSTEDLVVFKRNAVHDWASHIADGFGHGGIAYRYHAIEGKVLGSLQAARTGEEVTRVETKDYYGDGIWG